MGFGRIRQVRAMAEPIIAYWSQQLHICPCQRSVYVASLPGPSRIAWGRKNSSFQIKLVHDRKSAEDLFFARGLLTPLQKEISNAQERHSCRGKRLDSRSRHRRVEALPPGADRRWKEAGHGAPANEKPDEVLWGKSEKAVHLRCQRSTETTGPTPWPRDAVLSGKIGWPRARKSL